MMMSRASLFILLLAVGRPSQADSILCQAYCLKLRKLPSTLVREASIEVEDSKPITVKIDSKQPFANIKMREIMNRLNEACGKDWVPSRTPNLINGMLLDLIKHEICRKQEHVPTQEADAKNGDAAS